MRRRIIGSNDFDCDERLQRELGRLECPAGHRSLVGVVEQPVSIFILDGKPDNFTVALNASNVSSSARFDGRAGSHQDRLSVGRSRRLQAFGLRCGRAGVEL